MTIALLLMVLFCVPDSPVEYRQGTTITRRPEPWQPQMPPRPPFAGSPQS